MSSRKILIVVISVVLLSGILLGILAFSLFFFFTISPGSETKKMETTKYRYFTYNSKTKKETVGLVNMSPLNQDFISYETDFRHVLISPFDSSQYKCTGTCDCMNDRRTTTASLLGRLFFLMASAGSVGMMVAARNAFQEECVSKFQDSCPSNSIESNVEDCEPTQTSHSSDSTENKKTDEKSGKRFLCTGKCIDILEKLEDQDIYEMIRQKQEFENCADFELSMKVSVGSTEYELLGQKEGINKMDDLSLAGWKFVSKHLRPFCREKGLLTLPEQTVHELVICDAVPQVANLVMYGGKPFNVPLGYNPTIMCIRDF